MSSCSILPQFSQFFSKKIGHIFVPPWLQGNILFASLLEEQTSPGVHLRKNKNKNSDKVVMRPPKLLPKFQTIRLTLLKKFKLRLPNIKRRQNRIQQGAKEQFQQKIQSLLATNYNYS